MGTTQKIFFEFLFTSKQMYLTPNEKEIGILRLLNEDLINLEKKLENTLPTNETSYDIHTHYELEEPRHKRSMLDSTIIMIKQFKDYKFLENITVENKETKLKNFKKTRMLFQKWFDELEKPEYKIVEVGNQKMIIKIEGEGYQLIELSKLCIPFSEDFGMYGISTIDNIQDAFIIEKREKEKEKIKNIFIKDINKTTLEENLISYLESFIIKTLFRNHKFKYKAGIRLPYYDILYYNFAKDQRVLRALVDNDYQLVVFENGKRIQYEGTHINKLMYSEKIIEKDSYEGNKILIYPHNQLPSIDITDIIIYKDN